MSIATTSSVVEYTCDGVLASFSVPFKFLDRTHLRVSRVLLASPYTETVLVIDSDYSVGGAGASTGGSVALLDPATDAPTGYKLRIRRLTPRTQGTRFSTQGAFSPKAHEEAFDRLTMINQELNDGGLLGTAAYNFLGPSADSGLVTAVGGNTPRSLAARFADTVNVKDYGAVGDGAADDTAAIQAAINATPAGGILFFPTPSSYYSAGALTLKAGITLAGPKSLDANEALAAPSSTGAVLRYTGTTGFFMTLASADSVQGVTFRDLVIDAHGSTGGALSLKSYRNKISRCVIRSGGAGSVGVLFTGGASWAGESSIDSKTQIYGFAVNVRAEGTATDGFIRDCALYGATSKDIELAQAAGWLVQGNHTYGPDRTISIDAQTGSARIVQNLVEGSDQVGFIGIKQILTQAQNTGTIAGNSIQLVSNDAVAISLSATTPTRGSAVGNSIWVFLGATGTVGVDVTGANLIAGDLGPNYMGSVATRYRSVFTNNPNIIDQNSDRLELSAAEIDFLSLGTSAKIRVVTATPEGSVIANTGSIALRTNGATGTAGYLKVAGSGNTAWRGITTQMTHTTASPAQITADQNNYAPVSAMETFWRLSSDASRTITGIAGGEAGRTLLLANVGAFDVVLAHNSGSSSVGNRIVSSTGAAVTIAPNAVAQLIYDATSTVWRVVSLF